MLKPPRPHAMLACPNMKHQSSKSIQKVPEAPVYQLRSYRHRALLTLKTPLPKAAAPDQAISNQPTPKGNSPTGEVQGNNHRPAHFRPHSPTRPAFRLEIHVQSLGRIESTHWKKLAFATPLKIRTPPPKKKKKNKNETEA